MWRCQAVLATTITRCVAPGVCDRDPPTQTTGGTGGGGALAPSGCCSITHARCTECSCDVVCRRMFSCGVGGIWPICTTCARHTIIPACVAADERKYAAPCRPSPPPCHNHKVRRSGGVCARARRTSRVEPIRGGDDTTGRMHAAGVCAVCVVPRRVPRVPSGAGLGASRMRLAASHPVVRRRVQGATTTTTTTTTIWRR